MIFKIGCDQTHREWTSTFTFTPIDAVRRGGILGQSEKLLNRIRILVTPITLAKGGNTCDTRRGCWSSRPGHHHGNPDFWFRHRREHRDLQPDQRRPAKAAAIFPA
jgi:hypothetical protein